MRKEFNRLIETLRDEVRQYAEMFIRLDEQYDLITHLSLGDFQGCAREIEIQCANIQVARRNRKLAQNAVAGLLHRETGMPVEEMLPLLPGPCQSLVQALLQANRGLLSEVLRSLERNRWLLARSLVRTRQLLDGLFPEEFEGDRFPDAGMAAWLSPQTKNGRGMTREKAVA